MACRGVAAGERGTKKNRNAVGPNDGNTNGARTIIANPARMVMVRKLFTKVNAAQINRSDGWPTSWIRPNRRASPRVTSGECTINGGCDRDARFSAILFTHSSMMRRISGSQRFANCWPDVHPDRFVREGLTLLRSQA